MKSKLNKLFPILDQAISATFNFLFVMVTSFILPTKEFVFINYIMLIVLLIVNVHNAIVFQPFLKFFTKTKNTNSRKKFVLKTLFIINLIAIPIIAIISFYLNAPFVLIILAIVWLFILVLYEFNRRISMLRGRWDLNFYIGLLLNILTWPIIIYFSFGTSTVTLFFILSIYLLITIIFTIKNYNDFWIGVLDKEYDKFNIFKENKEFYKFGFMLLGGAVSFWFISGGYLLYIGKFLTADEVALLRTIQNMLNGILIVLTALDNVILSGTANGILKKLSSIKSLIALFIIFYGSLIYIVFNLFYDFGNILYVLSIWLLFYLIMSFAKVYMSLLKFNGESKSVFISQGIGSIIYLFTVTLMYFNGIKLNVINVSLLWIPISVIILLISLKDLKSIKLQEKILNGGIYE
jgi:O-antigen/teichoic acid export membrane protein